MDVQHSAAKPKVYCSFDKRACTSKRIVFCSAHAHYKDSTFSIVFTISRQNTIAHQYGCLLLLHLQLFIIVLSPTSLFSTVKQGPKPVLLPCAPKFKAHTDYEMYITCTVHIPSILVWGWMFECEQIFVFNWIIAGKYSLVYYKIFFC